MIFSSVITVFPQSTFAATRSMNVNEWLASCKAATNRIADNGGYYSSSGCPTAYFEKKFYKKTLKSKTRLHCADYVSWCLQKYGVLPAGKRFWVRGQTIKGKNASYVKKSNKIQKIYIAKKGVLASTLVNKTGTKSLKKGDLISVVKANGKGNHIMIYAGKVNGKMTYYQVSKVCTKTGKKGSMLVRAKMQTSTTGPYGEPRVAMILRVKGLNYTDSYEVTTSAGENGTIGATRNVAWGESTTIEITPDEGYQIDTLQIDGKVVSIDADATSYTLKDVKAAHSVTVTFKAIPGYVTPETPDTSDDDTTGETEALDSSTSSTSSEEKSTAATKESAETGSTTDAATEESVRTDNTANSESR